MNKKILLKIFINRFIYFSAFIAIFFLVPANANSATEKRFVIDMPKVAIGGVRCSDIKISAEEKMPDGWKLSDSYNGDVEITGLKNLNEPVKNSESNINKKTEIFSKETDSEFKIHFSNGTAKISNVTFTGNSLKVSDKAWATTEEAVFYIPGILSIFPPLIAILLSLITHNVLVALFSGIWFGSVILYHYNPLNSLFHVFDKYILDVIANKSHISIILFSIALGGMIGIVANSGGIQGIVNILTKKTKSWRAGQFSTWLMGILIFFDDYASALLVGNTMRPYTDNLKISREKLSFIVDSTAAPVAGLAVISTWIGFELGQVDNAMKLTGLQQYNAYDILISALPYNFYCIFLLIFVLFITLTGRDFSLMYKAEIRSYHEGKLNADGASPMLDSAMSHNDANAHLKPFASNALVPIISVVLITIFGMIYTGLDKLGLGFGDITTGNLRNIMGASSTSLVLLWSAFGGSIIAGIMAIARGNQTLNQTVDIWVNGAKSMMFALIILTLAWTLSDICSELNTNYYIISMLGKHIPFWMFPTLVFIISCLTSFATGTSYGTMGIIFPLVIPLIFSMLNYAGIPPISAAGYHPVLLGVIGAVLAGAIFGDHCSPISDTTVMSAMSSGADLIDHVRTQLPYGLVICLISIICGFLPVSFGVSPWISLILGAFLLLGILYIWGKKVEILDK